MGIDPAVLTRQRVDVGAVPPPLRIVRSKTPTCSCGKCKRCNNRKWMAAYRARDMARSDARTVDPSRKCVLCSGLILRCNSTGVCTPCQKRMRCTVAEKLARLEFVADGGGI